jgi:hypothetical protein
MSAAVADFAPEVPEGLGASPHHRQRYVAQ